MTRFTEWDERDKYGRRVHVVAIMKHYQHRPTGVVVTMPKTFREMYPGRKYLVNNWEKRGDAAVSYWPTRKLAIEMLKTELLEADRETAH